MLHRNNLQAILYLHHPLWTQYLLGLRVFIQHHPSMCDARSFS
ncbi:hypothetical protein F385_752 [Pantoea agglomerans 299R]|nr:hypothetical protein F385_752 [Pantoea agglomerans 299R]